MAKIKHYKSIYGRKRRSSRGPLAVALLLVGAALLVYIGYSIAGPVGDFVSGRLATEIAASNRAASRRAASEAVQSRLAASRAAQSKAAQSRSLAAQSGAATSGGQTAASGVVGITLPKSYLTNLSALRTVAAQAKKAGVNLAVIDLKAEDGRVNYNSGVKLATQYHLTATGVDASKAAKILSDAGITPCARICAFEDHLTPKLVRTFSVLYSRNHSYRWLDGSGQYWTNPCNTQAQNYIVSLAKEAVGLGYTDILLDGVTFPTGHYQYYGTGTVSAEDTLKNFVSAMDRSVDAAGGKLLMHVSQAAAVGKASSETGQDQSVYGYACDYLNPDVTPSSYSNSLASSAVSSAVSGASSGLVSSAAGSFTTQPAKTVFSIASYLKGLAQSNQLSSTVATLQTGSYSSSQISGAITALKQAGITSYILEDSAGNYDFSALSSQ